jgi:hypothetical protein
MSRLPLFLALCLPTGMIAQTAPPPRIDFNAAGGMGTSGTTGQGTATVSGKVVLPPGWTLSIHTLTIRYAKDGGSTTLNTLLPITAPNFNTQLDLKSGSYSVWAVIDVKDPDGKERQISSDQQSVNIP